MQPTFFYYLQYCEEKSVAPFLLLSTLKGGETLQPKILLVSLNFQLQSISKVLLQEAIFNDGNSLE